MLELITESMAERLVSLDDAITEMEGVFRALDAGEGEVFPVAVGHGRAADERFGVKSGAFPKRGVIGAKLGTYWPRNGALGLPNHGSTVLLLDPATGFPRALVAASHLTSLRTAAADAVAVKVLSRPDAKILGVVGAGHQAYFDALAISRVRALETVLVWSRTQQAAQALVEKLAREGLPAQPAPLETVAATADILSTVTPARGPLIEDRWIKPGAHISAMGADGRGKYELDPHLAARAVCVADVVEQAITLGELEIAYEQGILPRERIQTLGGVLQGRTPGREHNEDITLFDSSGFALQDLSIAELALTKARARGETMSLEW